jgi:hypothetical protein
MFQLSRRSSKLSNYSEKAHIDVIAMQLSTRVVGFSRSIEHIINQLQHQVQLIKAVKTEDSMESISGS